MLFKKKEEIPRRPWICGTPLAEAIGKKDKSAIKKAYDYQYTTQLNVCEWDLKYKNISEIEKAEVEIRIGELRQFQRKFGFGPWYHENDLEDNIKFTD